jgi:hypothetical protein
MVAQVAHGASITVVARFAWCAGRICSGASAACRSSGPCGAAVHGDALKLNLRVATGHSHGTGAAVEHIAATIADDSAGGTQLDTRFRRAGMDATTVCAASAANLSMFASTACDGFPTTVGDDTAFGMRG